MLKPTLIFLIGMGGVTVAKDDVVVKKVKYKDGNFSWEKLDRAKPMEKTVDPKKLFKKNSPSPLHLLKEKADGNGSDGS